MIWHILVNADGDPASISSQPITDYPQGWSVVQIDSPGQPNVGEWFDPVSGGTVMVGKSWDRAARAWTTMITPQVVDRVTDDLAADQDLVDVWQRLTVAQRTALRTRLARLLGRRRYRYLTESTDLED